MIREIVDSINARLDYSYKDVLLGVVHPHSVKGKSMPITSDGVTHPEAVPDGSKASIVYWEDYGSRVIVQAVRYRFLEHTLRLVVWLNFDRIEQSYDECIRELMAAIPQKLGSVLIAKGGQVPKSTDIFARYDYKERKQYITWPYDVIALTIIVKYPDTGCYIPLKDYVDDADVSVDVDLEIDDTETPIAPVDCLITSESLDGTNYTDLEGDIVGAGVYKPMNDYNITTVADIHLDGVELVYPTQYWFDGNNDLTIDGEWLAEKIVDGCIVLVVTMNNIIIPTRYIRICPCEDDTNTDET
jgi:hypothetical protein